jgi:hypothetical protein
MIFGLAPAPGKEGYADDSPLDLASPGIPEPMGHLAPALAALVIWSPCCAPPDDLDMSALLQPVPGAVSKDRQFKGPTSL